MYHLTIVVAALCALTIGIYANGHGPPPEMKAAAKKCIEELGGNEEIMKTIYHHEDIIDPKFKCVYACIMKELGSMNEDGTVNIGKMGEKIPADVPRRDELIETIKTCETEKGDDECDTALRIRKCFEEKLPMKPM